MNNRGSASDANVTAIFFKLKNTSRYYMHATFQLVSLQVFLQLETLSEQREENQNCAARVL